jgi:hypothetical protein
MLKKAILCLFILASLSAVGCKKDDEIRSVVKDLDAFTNELVQKVETAGVDEGQKFMDAKKSEIKAKLDSIKDVRGFQVSDETKKFMTESLTKNVTDVATLQIKHISQSVKDPAFKDKLEKLVKDYTALLTS